MDTLWEIVLSIIFIVGGYALLLFTIRVLCWLTDVILLGGW